MVYHRKRKGKKINQKWDSAGEKILVSTDAPRNPKAVIVSLGNVSTA